MPAASAAMRELRTAASRIREDRTHGASWLAQAAARALGDAATAISDTSDDVAIVREAAAWAASARELAHIRPSMAALASTVARVFAAGWDGRHSAEKGDPTALRAALERSGSEARRLLATWEAAASQIAAHIQPFLRGTVLTHSHSGTVEQVLIASATGSSPLVERVIVTESRPGSEGVTLARVLAAQRVPVTLIADAAAGLVAGQAQSLVVGADSVRVDGSVVNKVGTYPLALVARAARIPCYVLAESVKVAPADWPLALEENAAPELIAESGPGIAVNTAAFDHTPAALVHSIVCERGILSRAQVRAGALAAARDLAMLDAR